MLPSSAWKKNLLQDFTLSELGFENKFYFFELKKYVPTFDELVGKFSSQVFLFAKLFANSLTFAPLSLKKMNE